MTQSEGRQCLDCGDGPIITMTCEPCTRKRQAASPADRWFQKMCEDWEDRYGPLPVKKTGQKQPKKKPKVYLDWDNKPIKLPG